MTIASIMNMAGPDMIVILLIILVFFGAKRLPGLARGMRQAMQEFKKGKDESGLEERASRSVTRTNPDEEPAASRRGSLPAVAGAKSTV